VQPAVNDQIDVLLKRILAGAEEERSLNMTAIVKPFTFDAMTAAVFSHPLNMQTSDDEKWISDDFTESNTRLNHYLNVPDLFRLHVHNLTDLLQIRLYMKFADLITQMVTTAEEAQSNIFTILERAAPKDEEGSVDESEVLQESLLLIAAGPDTMAAAICATLFYLSRHKESYHRLSDEIRSSFSKGTNINPGPQLMSCRYLRACIDESLRMSPPGAGVLWREQDLHCRNSRETLTIDGHVIPPGTQFGVGIYALHHNEDYFPSPFTYKPERWFDSETSAEQLKLMHDAFSPFSIGARSCPGKTMAYTQMSLVLAKVLWYFDFETTPGYLGRIGLRNVPLSYGEIEDEYDSSDIFVAKHDGPHLIFKAREDVDGLHS
jgi:cytochrome P450